MADAVADLTFALLLGLVRHIPTGDRTVKAGDYNVPIGEDLPSMTLGLLGCGRIGAETVRRAKGFRMRVLVNDPFVDDATLQALGAEAVDRDRLLAEADVISLHVPMSADNANIANADFLAAMKKGSFLINTARGGLVDEPALIAALQNGHLAGAGLDCQASEPPVGVSAELVALDNVVASPHSGSFTVTARIRMAQMAARSMVDVLQGRVPEQVVNREVLEKLELS
jgi:phosphoglycerate dehydrogenase-like enzyme